ncbi:MAG: glycine zipper 2TM domain-containing protein [Rhodoferax sp.]
MNTMHPFAASTLVVVALTGLSACSGMSTQDRNTAIGAGVGAVGGSVLTGGSTVGTVGGAVVGGVIGNQVK